MKQLKMGGSFHSPKGRDLFEFDIEIRKWRYILEIICTITHSKLTALQCEVIFTNHRRQKCQHSAENTWENSTWTQCAINKRQWSVFRHHAFVIWWDSLLTFFLKTFCNLMRNGPYPFNYVAFLNRRVPSNNRKCSNPGRRCARETVTWNLTISSLLIQTWRLVLSLHVKSDQPYLWAAKWSSDRN